MENKKIKVGVIGAGLVSDIYLNNMINRFDNLDVCAICSKHIEHAKTKAEQFGITACTLEEMLEVLNAILTSGEKGTIERITSVCEIPEAYYTTCK